MSKEARSKGACWTCKLRRKKCDEERPACSACSSINIPCFGYDLPPWADGGEKQRAKAAELQIIVRELTSFRRRGRKGTAITQFEGAKTAGIETIHELSDIRLSSKLSKVETDLFVPDRLDGQTGQQAFQDIVSANFNVDGTLQRQNLTVDFLEYDSQANLLMHYLE